MSSMESARIWLVEGGDAAALSHVRSRLEAQGASVEMLDLSEAVERVVRDKGGKLLEGLKVMLRRARGVGEQDDAELEESTFSRVLDRGRPDLIVVASDSYLRGLDILSRMAGGSAVRVGLLPDYHLSANWLKGALHAYIVPHDALKQPLIDTGIEESRVFVAGPPIGEAFARELDGAALKESFGLDGEESGPVVLCFADAFEGDLDKLVFQMSLVEAPFEPIFYVGHKEDRAETLRRAARRHGLKARMLGHVANLEEFVAASDLVLVDSQDERMINVLAVDRPLAIVGSPGPVTTQIDFLIAQGVAWHTVDVLRLGGDLEVLLQGDRLARLQEAATQVGQPSGTDDVVEAIVAIYERREELARVDVAAPDDPDQPTQAGPFEIIGSTRPEGPAATPPGDSDQRPATAPSDGHSATPVSSPLSAAEAKDELAALIMLERDLERRLSQAKREQETWKQRLDLATDWNETELADEARTLLERHLAEGDHVNEELERVRAQKDKLKARVRQGREGGFTDTIRRTVRAAVDALPTPGDERFRDMEVERDLSDLRDRLRRELDE